MPNGGLVLILREVTIMASPDTSPGMSHNYRWTEGQPLSHLQTAVTELQAWIEKKQTEATDPTKAAQPIPTEDV